MEFLTREEVMNELQEPFQSFIERYGFDDIGIFEEQGQDNKYYLGYTINKGGKTYHIHTPFKKNDNGELAALSNKWTIETDEPTKGDLSDYRDLDSAFRELH